MLAKNFRKFNNNLLFNNLYKKRKLSIESDYYFIINNKYNNYTTYNSNLNYLNNKIKNKYEEYFNENGFFLIKNFVERYETFKMKTNIYDLVENWDHELKHTMFRADNCKSFQNKEERDNYFIDSGDKINFFTEKDSYDSNGLKKKDINKFKSLNKIGHGLHLYDNTFNKFCKSQDIKDILNNLGYIKPAIVQSMFIFKNNEIGGEVGCHKDSSYLITDPIDTCIGLWLAVDDATINNGCLWVKPKSHLIKPKKIFTRNSEYFQHYNLNSQKLIYEDNPKYLNDKNQNEDEFEKIYNNKEELIEDGFKPLECKRGDLIILDGNIDHISLKNKSKKNRNAFTLHIMDEAKSTWSKKNWMQYPEGKDFMRI